MASFDDFSDVLVNGFDKLIDRETAKPVIDPAKAQYAIGPDGKAYNTAANRAATAGGNPFMNPVVLVGGGLALALVVVLLVKK